MVRCSWGNRVRRAPAGKLRLFAASPLALGLLLSVGLTPAPAQVDDGYLEVNREYAIKAAYLYNFGRYVEWPPESFGGNDSPFVIGVLGKDPFGAILDEIAATKKVEGRRVIVRRFATMAEYKPCHILFVAASVAPDQKAAALKKAHGSVVLLVGEEAGFARQGGTVNFFIEQNKVRFEINLDAAKREQLRISSKLLSLARIVGARE
jgi:hypothetical protein